MASSGDMQTLLRDSRVRRLLVANTLGSIGSGITIFSVPWLLVHHPEGDAAYRWATFATTIVLFALAPSYGAWVDRHSRKTALLASEAWGLAATVTMAAVGLALGGFAPWQLMTIFFCGMLYYTLHYPAKFAMIQQMFDRSQYQSLIGLLEIQGQTAMMIAGGLGGVLVEHVPLWAILLFDAATYATSFLIQSTLPYEATHLTVVTSGWTAVPARSSVWHAVAEGWRWLRERPRLTVFLTCSLIPFVVVMAGNYLFPIYVAQTLRASATLFAGGEITFALRAILAGALLPRLISRHSAATTIPATMAGTLLGFGHAGCRVARSALLLHVVPHEFMGRVSGFYNVFDRVLRTLLVFALGIIDVSGPPAGFLVLLAVVAIALIGVIQSRSMLHTAPTPTPAPVTP
jgi:MFS family permease